MNFARDKITQLTSMFATQASDDETRESIVAKLIDIANTPDLHDDEMIQIFFVTNLYRYLAKITENQLTEIIINSTTNNFIGLKKAALHKINKISFTQVLLKNHSEMTILAMVKFLNENDLFLFVKNYSKKFLSHGINSVYLHIIESLSPEKLEQLFYRSNLGFRTENLPDVVFAELIRKLPASKLTKRAALINVGNQTTEIGITFDQLFFNFMLARRKGPLSIHALIEQTQPKLGWLSERMDYASIFHFIVNLIDQNELISLLSKLDMQTLLKIYIIDSDILFGSLKSSQTAIYNFLISSLGSKIHHEVTKKNTLALSNTEVKAMREVLFHHYIPSLSLEKQYEILSHILKPDTHLHQLFSFDVGLWNSYLPRIDEMRVAAQDKMIAMRFILDIFIKISDLTSYDNFDRLAEYAVQQPLSLEAICLDLAQQIHLHILRNDTTKVYISLNNSTRNNLQDYPVVKDNLIKHYPEFYEIIKKMVSLPASNATLFSAVSVVKGGEHSLTETNEKLVSYINNNSL